MIDNYVTGANGFIGSRLLKRLVGQNTVCIPHTDIASRKLEEPAARFFFLSTYGNLVHHENWKMAVQSNVLDMVSMLEQCRSRFVYVSTSSVGLAVQTMYSRLKRSAEEILLTLADIGHPVFIVRPYSVTGVGEQKDHLIPRLINSCYTGEQMPLYPFGVHDYIDIEDLLDGLLEISQKDEGGVFELGRGIRVDNDEVRKIVESVTGRKTNVVLNMTGRSYDNPTWFCQNPATKPKKTLRKSIEEMVAAYERTAKASH
jgi:nucleoside-diphosphate-sugar epimerase